MEPFFSLSFIWYLNLSNILMNERKKVSLIFYWILSVQIKLVGSQIVHKKIVSMKYSYLCYKWLLCVINSPWLFNNYYWKQSGLILCVAPVMLSGFNLAISLNILTTKRQHMHAINNKDFHYTFKSRKHITNKSFWELSGTEI